jgi:type II secretory pathway component PulF
VTLVLIVFFVPKFKNCLRPWNVRERCRTRPSFFCGSVIFWDAFGILVAMAAAGGIALLRRWARITERRQQRLDSIKTKVPVFGPISQQCGFTILPNSGDSVEKRRAHVKGMEISSDSSGNVVLGQAIRKSAENISAGESLSTPLTKCGSDTW